MQTYDETFLAQMRERLDVDLAGVVPVAASEALREMALPFLPTARSVLVLAKESYAEVIALAGTSREVGEPERGEVLVVHANYLYGRLNRALHEFAEVFRKAGHRSIPLCAAPGFVTDTRFVKSLFSYKTAAVLAGLGSIGRHSLLIAPGFGPRLRLACLVTEAPLPATGPAAPIDRCTGCNACIRICPTQAIEAPAPGETHRINPYACRAFRQAGLVCSVCLKACDAVTGGRAQATARKAKGSPPAAAGRTPAKPKPARQ